MVLVSEMYKKGYSIRKIAAAVQEAFDMPKPPSTETIFKDIKSLLTEWRSTRVENTDEAVQLELERIDYYVTELVEAWEKSKQDQKLKSHKQKGKSSGKGITPTEVEKTEKEEINYGDVRYISEIRQQLMERRKLLGLYQPDKIENTGSIVHVFQEVIDDGNNDGTGD